MSSTMLLPAITSGSLRLTPAQLQEFFDLFRDVTDDCRPRFNITPTQTVAAIRQGSEGRELAWLRWGLIPSWSKESKTNRPLINARAETAHEKPSFPAAFKRRRCLIPATGFYEWKQTGPKTKQPYHVHRQDDAPFAMAGLWERWDKGSEPIKSCTIITTTANDLMSDIHDRMPVILHRDDTDVLLDPDNDDSDELRSLLMPYTPKGMITTPISTAINNVRNDSAGILTHLK